MFAAADKAQFVAWVEGVVDSEIDAVAAAVGSAAGVETASPAEACRVQAVASREVIGSRHRGYNAAHHAAGIGTRAEWIVCEHIDLPHIGGIQRGVEVAVAFDGSLRRRREIVSVLASGKVSEDAVSRGICQYVRHDALLFQSPLSFVKEKEEGLVFYNWSAQARAELIAVDVILWHSLEIVAGCAGVPHGVTIRPKRGPVKLIRS